jgi:hypothetical protein
MKFHDPDPGPPLPQPRGEEPEAAGEADDQRDERDREERGNLGPDEEPGFGQGA